MGLAVTTCPGLTFWPPSTMTRSPSFKPFATVIRLPWAWPDLHPPGLHLLLRPDDQDEGTGLIDLQGGLRDHQSLFRRLFLDHDLGELAGHQHAVRIRELRPHRDRVRPGSTFTSRKLNLPVLPYIDPSASRSFTASSPPFPAA